MPRPSTDPGDHWPDPSLRRTLVGMTTWAAVFGAAGAVAGAGSRMLLGRLRRGARVRAPVCELAVGAAWAGTGAGWAAGIWPGRWVPLLLALAWFGVAAGVVDLRHHRLPDALTLPAVPVAFLLVAPLGGAVAARAAPGALAAAGVYAVVHLASPGSLGAGDVKLAASLGAVLAAVSWGAPVLAAVLASALTAALAAARAATTRVAATRAAARSGPGGPHRLRSAPEGDARDDGPGAPARARWWDRPVPHGPSMLLATTVVVAAAAAG